MKLAPLLVHKETTTRWNCRNQLVEICAKRLKYLILVEKSRVLLRMSGISVSGRIVNEERP